MRQKQRIFNVFYFSIDRAMIDVEKLLAAGGKCSRSLHAWEKERAAEQLTSSMSTHSINETTNKTFRKSKKNKEDFLDDNSISSTASSSFAVKSAVPYKRPIHMSKLVSNSLDKEYREEVKPPSPSSV